VTSLVEILLAVIELVKAELQQSKKSFFSFIAALILFLVGMFFLTSAFILFLVAIGIALTSVLPTSLAILITGIITVLLGFILIFIGRIKLKQ
jgi:hypothetical protein